ncbi:MAG: helix-turn-helix domain-containing protein, partial [Hyphomicrobiales bacterium]
MHTGQDLSLPTNLPPPKGRNYFCCSDHYPSPGLPKGVSRWDVLRALKMARRSLGLSAALLEYVELLIVRTNDLDWIAGAAPIVFTGVQTAARMLNVSVRQINHYERRLADAGLLTWRDSGNRRRYGKRGEDGTLLFAFGADLTPLIERYDKIVSQGEAELLDQQLRAKTIGVIRSCRRVLSDGVCEANTCGLTCDVVAQASDQLARLPRTFAPSWSTAELCQLSLEIEAVALELKAVLSPADHTETSGRAEENVR